MTDTSTLGKVIRYLVTADEEHKYPMWLATTGYANWIQGRDNGDRETWLVTCFAGHAEHFLAAARETGVTVEEIQYVGGTENYVFRVGDRAAGWSNHT